MEEWQAERFRHWRQTPETRLTDGAAAVSFIQALGLVTLYPTSPEYPDLFRAFMGNHEATIDLDWDGVTRLPTTSWESPASKIYEWRWELGVRDDLVYTTLVRHRPTWVSRNLWPAILRLRGEMSSLEELWERGQLSGAARRIIQVLDEAEAPLPTPELRKRAGFPTGKAERAAYLKAIDELAERLLIVKRFTPGSQEMEHGATHALYPDTWEEAMTMTAEAAMDQVLAVVLSPAMHLTLATWAKHGGFAPPEVLASAERLGLTSRS